MGCLKAIATSARDALAGVVGLATRATATAATKVATAAVVASDAAGGELSRTGVNRTTAALYAGAACCVTTTVLLFTTGLPAVVVPVACLLAFAWLARDVRSFVTGHASGEARAEAVLRLSAVALVGAVLLAATLASPALGGMALSCVAAATLYKFVCSDAGRFEIGQRWGQTAASPAA
jgi:hypothetical protein